MKKCLTKIFTTLFAVLIITSLGVFSTNTVSGQTTDQTKAIDFMENILPVDLSKYSINTISDAILDGFPLADNNRKIHDILYELTSENSKLHISFAFEKGVLRTCFITALEGQVITNSRYTDTLDAVKAFLEKYQTYTKIDSSNLIAMLDKVDTTQDFTTITTENVKLTIEKSYFGEEVYTSYTWTHVINGVDYTGVSIIFDKVGQLYSIGDSRLLYTIGDTSINISLEQAVDIAIENLWSYSYEMPDGSIVKDFKVSKDAVMVELVVGPVDFVDYELRPYYDVRLYLDEVYPGNVFGITAFIWANTGEIISYSNMATGGIDYADNANSFNVEPQPAISNNTLIAVALTVIAVIVAVSAISLIIKKNHK
jgi:hypothetical protein